MLAINASAKQTPETISATDEHISETFVSLQNGDESVREYAIALISNHWREQDLPFAIDTLYLLRDRKTSASLVEILEKHTAQHFGRDTFKWLAWLWQRKELVHPSYGDFKSALYGLIDPAFADYFGGGRERTIRLDEVVWGGVRRDGIPPLRQPKMIAASSAQYLNDSDVVFGIAIGDDVRAYPKRILAWHEMFVDTVGGKSVAGVY